MGAGEQRGAAAQQDRSDNCEDLVGLAEVQALTGQIGSEHVDVQAGGGYLGCLKARPPSARPPHQAS